MFSKIKKKHFRNHCLAFSFVVSSFMMSCSNNTPCINIEGNIEDLDQILGNLSGNTDCTNGGGGGGNNPDDPDCGCPSFAVVPCEITNPACEASLGNFTFNITNDSSSCDSATDIFDYVDNVDINLFSTGNCLADGETIAVNCTGFIQIGISDSGISEPIFTGLRVPINPIYLEYTSTTGSSQSGSISFPAGTVNPPGIASQNSRIVMFCSAALKAATCQQGIPLQTSIYAEVCNV